MNPYFFSHAQLMHYCWLSTNAVHVWCASLDWPSHNLYKVLSRDEQARADRFYFERDRNRFIVARGLLRTILGGYLGTKSSQVQFCYGPYGKPALKSELQGKEIHFSVSHSSNLVLYAFSWDRQVGIDVEYLRLIPEIDSIAEHFFSNNEIHCIRTLRTTQKLESFFRIWTSKEAYLKAVGYGLSDSLTQIEVSLTPIKSAHFVAIHGNRREARQWHLQALRPRSDYLASLVIRGYAPQVIFRQIPDEDLSRLTKVNAECAIDTK